MRIKIAKWSGHSIEAPKRATDGSAAWDLQSIDQVFLQPGERMLVHTGYAWEIPDGHCGLVLPRSGLAIKHGVTVVNAPGLIDSDYRGEVCVILINHGRDAWSADPGDRIAQMLVLRLADYWPALDVKAELNQTDRGAGGFGSTGVGNAPD